jgi:hypothetical protein
MAAIQKNYWTNFRITDTRSMLSCALQQQNNGKPVREDRRNAAKRKEVENNK